MTALLILLFMLLRGTFFPFFKLVQWIANLLYIGTDVEDRSEIDLSKVEAYKSLDFTIPREAYGQDAAKFVGMWYHAMPFEHIWAEVLKHFDFANNEFVRAVSKGNGWSSDMMSGMLLAITTRWKENKLTLEEKQFMSDYAHNMVTKLWFPFKQDMDDLSRGFVWKPFAPVMNGNNLQPLVILKLGAECSSGARKVELLTFYYLMQIVMLPYFYLGGLWDATVIVNRGPLKFYAQWSYTTHSTALVCATGSMLGIWGSKKGLKTLYRKHSYNADIFTLYKIHVEKEVTNEDRTVLENMHKALVYSRDKTKQLPQPNNKVYNIKRFRWDNLYENSISGFRCQDYCWERSQFDRGYNDCNYGDLDIIFSKQLADRAVNLSGAGV